MKYREALQAIDTVEALKHLELNYLCQGAYVRFKCKCGSEAAAFKAIGDKKNLWFCPDCKQGGNILSYAMAKKGTEYEETKQRLLKLSPTQKRLEQELKLQYDLQFTKEIEQLGLAEEACKALEIGFPKGKTMLSGCLAFTVRNEDGLKIAYYGIRKDKPVYHKSFNPELYLYGLNWVKDHAILVKDMVDCAKRITNGEPAICNFGLPYISPYQCGLLNKLEKVDLKISPDMALTLARQLTTHYRFI